MLLLEDADELAAGRLALGPALQEDGTELRLTALRLEFGGKVKDKQFGKTEGDVTCGGTETSPEGTFSFFATLIAV